MAKFETHTFTAPAVWVAIILPVRSDAPEHDQLAAIGAVVRALDAAQIGAEAR